MIASSTTLVHLQGLGNNAVVKLSPTYCDHEVASKFKALWSVTSVSSHYDGSRHSCIELEGCTSTPNYHRNLLRQLIVIMLFDLVELRIFSKQYVFSCPQSHIATCLAEAEGPLSDSRSVDTE